MQRVSVVGNAGSGKTSLGRRIAAAIGTPFVELDTIQHLPNWTPIDPGLFLLLVGELAVDGRWVIAGSCRTVVVEGPVWERADTVVWPDLPRCHRHAATDHAHCATITHPSRAVERRP